VWGWTAAVAKRIIFLTGLPLAIVIKRIYDQEEAARSVIEAGGNPATPRQLSSDPQFTLREALRHRSFWLLSVAMALRHMVTEGVSVHFVILLVDRGWSTEAASGLLGLSALIGAPARVGMGWLGDMLDKRRLMMGLLLALSFSVLLMGYTAVAIVFTPCMIIYSLAYGGLASLQEPIRADYFGTKALPAIRVWPKRHRRALSWARSSRILYDLTKSYACVRDICRRRPGVGILHVLAETTGEEKLVMECWSIGVLRSQRSFLQS
jgi:hypothetical protein